MCWQTTNGLSAKNFHRLHGIGSETDKPSIRTDIRMTLNTLEDFEIQQKIFAAIIKENPNFAIRKIIKWLNSDFEILVMVKNEIFRNQKYESLITAFTIW